MDSGPSKKGFWNNDRISDLPDEILCKILSYLPLKDVVTTSILSTRWKPLSPASVSLIQLDFRDSRGSEFFHRCMHKLMNVTFRDLRFVERIDFSIDDLFFYAVFEHADWEATIASWVAAFTRLNVQSLRLVSCLFGSKGLCGSLHGCSTLVELELSDFRDFDLSDEFLLPNLKRLLLYEFETDWDTNAEKLLRGCPVLNDFRIVKCNFGISDIFHIKHPNIRRLFVEGFATCMAEFGSPNLEVDCPNLEVMVFKERHVANFVLKSVKSLHSVCIELAVPGEWDEGANLTELVKACSSTTRLWLTGNLVMCLFRWSVPLPTFPNLTFLALGRLGRYGWRMLVRLLESAPNLTELTFEKELDFTLPYTESKSLLPSFTRVYTDSKSMLPRSLRASTAIKSSRPGSLLLNIKKIEIWEFKWSPDEMKLIEYFLNKGEVLQELIVHCLPCENKSGLKELSMLPRYSDTCHVLFKDESNLEKSRDSGENWF